MSLKSIEMQIALPRTFDASKLHDQLSQRGQHINDHATQEMKQEEIKLRSSVIKQERKDEAKLNQDGENSKDHREQKENKSKNNQEEIHQPTEKHPYKGNFVDYSG
jgi:hypothetical protein